MVDCAIKGISAAIRRDTLVTADTEVYHYHTLMFCSADSTVCVCVSSRGELGFHTSQICYCSGKWKSDRHVQTNWKCIVGFQKHWANRAKQSTHTNTTHIFENGKTTVTMLTSRVS